MSLLVPWRRAAWLTIAICVIAVVGMGIAFHDRTTASGFDKIVSRQITDWAGPVRFNSFLLNCLRISDPMLVAGVLIMMAAVAAAIRWREALALVVATPAVALFLTEIVLKPWVHRTTVIVGAQSGYPPAFPSGHETGLSSVLVLILLALLRSRISVRLRAIGVAVLVAIFGLGAIGLVAWSYHYATDTIGALAVCLASTLSLGLAIDAVVIRRATRRALPREDRVPAIGR
ncbi:MAG: hypothetical protein M3070_12625 [Actinomycetota bacterium]|nr:hypothetical protein [Actinomycetota bacterium]